MKGICNAWPISKARKRPNQTIDATVLFAGETALWVTAFCGMAYSLYPYVVPENITIYEAASTPENLFVILSGMVFVLPTVLAYTVLA